MGSVVGGLFGGGGGEMRAMRAEQERQRATLERENARLRRAEEGRNKLRSSRRGLLAFLDDDPELADTMGGGGSESSGTWRRRSGRGA